MKVELIGHDEKYALEQSLLTLFPGEKPVYGTVDAKLRRHLHALVLFGERHARPARVGGFVDRAVNGLFAGEERE